MTGKKTKILKFLPYNYLNSFHFIKIFSSRKREISKTRNSPCFFRVFVLSCFRDGYFVVPACPD
ncbi:hypothetical protein D1AOALGA4SA_3519 [Olavius algarvensis Delta 1 endosymbiont]|nr:hypothetical protein D1AOALGA4SA_3519 [Olavius algarvensis Delta 1 endosymbiont]